LNLSLLINQPLFFPGDTFALNTVTVNATGGFISADQYVMLDALGQYYFWPDWQQAVTYQPRLFPPGPTEEIILNFIWPPGAGELNGIMFYAADFQPGTYDVISMDAVTFGFSETRGSPTPTAQPTASPRPSPPPSPPPSQTPVVISVPGNQEWTDSGIDVFAGDVWRIESSGEICFHSGDCAGTTVGPCGTGGEEPCYDPECGQGQPYLPGFYHGAVLARAGLFSSWFLACEPGNYEIAGSGRLYFGINDAVVSDNDGEFMVEVSKVSN